MRKQKAILIDVHNTLINKNGQHNNNVIDIIKLLSKEYYILLITAHYYETRDKFLDSLGDLKDFADNVFFNNNPSESDDVDIKKALFVYVIRPKYDVTFVIDNNKHVIKMFNKLRVDTLRYKND
jgi:hydroxymethylpyrimidine pyrophosphatase-like HAD family hydrolase